MCGRRRECARVERVSSECPSECKRECRAEAERVQSECRACRRPVGCGAGSKNEHYLWHVCVYTSEWFTKLLLHNAYPVGRHNYRPAHLPLASRARASSGRRNAEARYQGQQPCRDRAPKTTRGHRQGSLRSASSSLNAEKVRPRHRLRRRAVRQFEGTPDAMRQSSNVRIATRAGLLAVAVAIAAVQASLRGRIHPAGRAGHASRARTRARRRGRPCGLVVINATRAAPRLVRDRRFPRSGSNGLTAAPRRRRWRLPAHRAGLAMVTAP